MPRLLFVDTLNRDAPEMSRRRRHTALITHGRRWTPVTSKSEITVEPAFSKFRVVQTTVRTSTARRRSIDRDQDNGCQRAVFAQSGKFLQFRFYPNAELPAPLCLGDNAAPSAALDGKKAFLHFTRNTIQLRKAIYTPFNISSRSAFSPAWIETLADDMVFHAYFTLFSEQHRRPGTAPTPQLLQHYGDAISKLKDHLTNGHRPSDQALLMIIFLAAVEQLIGNRAAYTTHRQILGKLIDERGGLDSLEPHTMWLICELEMMWTIQSGNTVFQYQPKPPVRTKCSLALLGHPTTIPLGFIRLAAEGKLSEQTLLTVSHAINISDKQQNELYPPSPTSPTTSRPFSHYWQAFPYFHPQYPHPLTLEDLLETALVQYCIHQVNPPYGPSLPSVNFVSRYTLTKHLPDFVQHIDTLAEAEQEALIWIIVITLSAWRKLPGYDLIAEGEALRQRLRQYMMFERLQWDKVEMVCRKFLWNVDLIHFIDRCGEVERQERLQDQRYEL